jgi:hypothetical protein
MGAWSHTAFGNDDALDFIEEMKEDGVAALENAFEVVNHLDEADYIEAPDACVALAAAELVAAAAGRAPADLPDQAREVVDALRGRPGLRERALVAVARILANSQLRELWGDTADFALWEGSVRDLQGRLK